MNERSEGVAGRMRAVLQRQERQLQEREERFGREKERDLDHILSEEEREEEDSDEETRNDLLQQLAFDEDEAEDEDIASQAADTLREAFTIIDPTNNEGPSPPHDETILETIKKLQLLHQRALLRNSTDTPENPTRRRLRRRDPVFPLPAITFSDSFKARFPDEEARERLKEQFKPLFKEKEEERWQTLRDFRRDEAAKRLWKTSPLHRDPTTAAYHPSNRISWLMHEFIPLGYENNPVYMKEGADKFDVEVAYVQFKAEFLPEQERTLETRKRLLIDYINHFFCHVAGTGQTFYYWRQARPFEVSNDGRKWSLKVVKTAKEIEIILSAKIMLRNPAEAEEGAKPKALTMGKLWLESLDHLRFMDTNFSPSLFHQKLYGDPSYNPKCDDYLNLYQGWAVTRENAAKYHHRLYRRCFPKKAEDRGITDVMPEAGWLYLIFIDRTNFTQLTNYFEEEKADGATIKIGELVTCYHALPNNPFARGPPWVKNPYWEEDHVPLQQQLRKYNFDYFYSVPPAGFETCLQPADDDMSEEDAHFYRQGQIASLWFDNPKQPALSCGVSVAPILHYIFHALANGQEAIYIYMMNWLAKWRQSLEPNTTCPVLRSDPGTGKTNLFVHSLGAMVGAAAFFETSDGTDLLGYYTGEFSTKLLVHLDEFRVEDQKQMNKLKAIITGSNMRERRMQTNVDTIQKRFATIISANMYMVLTSDPGERRFVFLELPKSLAGSIHYLTACCRVLYADGLWIWEGDKQYPDTNTGPGVYLLAHYLDMWPVDPSVSLLQIPQNMTLYEHQINSLDSVGQWWFDKLKTGSHVDWAAIDDLKAANVARVRHQQQLVGLRQAFLDTYESEIYANPVTHREEPLFTRKWLNSHGKWDNHQQQPDWGAIIVRLLSDFPPQQQHAYSPHLRPFIGNEFLGPLKIDFCISLGEGLLNASYSTLMKTRKYHRGLYFYNLYMRDHWLRFVWKEQLYNNYLQQSANRTNARAALEDQSKFYQKLDDLSQGDSVQCSFSYDTRLQVRKACLIQRDQFAGLVPNMLTAQRGQQGAQRSSQRHYVRLDSLENHRRAFFEKMHWDEVMWDRVWDVSFKLPVPNLDEKPWSWFGDRVAGRGRN